MIARHIDTYDDFSVVMDMDDSVRKRRSLTRFQQQEPELFEQYNLRWQMEQEKPDQKQPRKGRKKAV